ncbi:endonuclease domain-containing protein [Pseudoxanthomonas sp. F37]|uniref:UDP-N-acetyl-alpha-D-muramoyl-L-alanyl-L- glutamate epimerase n=1 Tax=Pseudoxanthomonas TaxID=83618 RepID=UPI001FD1C2D5|nr:MULTISPECIES: UDP-N-acetyl-alpha-D-muramoyl-L-alanyl-L-glutamate epimerase [Pseudoxanthomonas]UOV04673.1 endonuclease domain-containing protein [Pseudoxanthomonas mexicana]UOV09684.1 endonuclease domain-containing protein [Pseudoxanthomonas sp. F37]
MTTFDKSSIRAFRFVRCSFDAQSGIARLVYAFDDGPELTETVTVPGAPFVLDAARAQAVEQAVRLLHLITGVSYYKAAVPNEIRIEGYAIDAATAVLMEQVYVHGLGEFAYRNGLSLHGRVRFPVGAQAPSAAPPAGLRAHALVAIGGGKDSLVSIEALRGAGTDQTVTWIGGSQLIAACAARTGLPTLNIGRALAPELFEYNRQGAWNGHIPVTAINSAIMVLAALLHGVDQVVFSNERSASYGSMIPGTGEVNHQWSKGWAFEQAFGEYVQSHVAADLQYYSLLRPLSELAVARQFARTDHYDAHFSSCNRNFHLLGERPTNRWCGVCPKCHFVFLALAPFMPKPRLVGIFGRNLLDDANQTAGFDALLEYQDHKPFECVGEGQESRAAMATLGERPEWREDVIVARFNGEIRPQLAASELAVAPLLEIGGEHRIPAALWERLRANFAA